MGTRPYATTNERLAEACELVRELIGWAESDAEHAAENDATDTARDDRARVKTLNKALALLEQCERA